MPRRPREKSKTGIYHVVWRGANRQEIFHDDDDRAKFMDAFWKSKLKSGMKVYAWCLMNNHIHLLLKEGKEDLSITMKRLGVSYALYYNWKYRTTGHLFQDRFKSECVESDRYLLTVTRYIHQNPVKARMVVLPDHWEWSSCAIYYGQRADPKFLLDKDFLLSLFSYERRVAIAAFKQFNELPNNDHCLDDEDYVKRLSDDEAREKIKELLYGMEVAHVKSLPRKERTDILRRIKRIEGISQRQTARILGISSSLIFKA